MTKTHSISYHYDSVYQLVYEKRDGGSKIGLLRTEYQNATSQLSCILSKTKYSTRCVLRNLTKFVLIITIATYFSQRFLVISRLLLQKSANSLKSNCF